MYSLMDQAQGSLDEATLAAYLAGSLSPEDRVAVERKLTRDAEARELLCMAQEAMDAALEVTDAPTPDAPASPSPKTGDRAPKRRSSRLERFGRYAGIAVLVFAIGLSLRLAFGPPSDVLRGDESDFAVEIVSPTLHIDWAPIEGAYAYHVKVWDPAEARIIADHQTVATELTAQDPFVQTLRSQLVPSKTYSLQIEAVDDENRLINRSELRRFQLAR